MTARKALRAAERGADGAAPATTDPQPAADRAHAASRKAALPLLRLSLQFADPQHRTLLARHRVARWVRAALQAPGEITVRVVGSDEGQALNLAYRDKAYATNVLTFSYAADAAPPHSSDPAPVLQADIVVCAPVVAQEAAALGLSLEAHYAHLLVHGTLHAQGHDHEDTSHAGVLRAQAMEDLESRIMQTLGFADPYGVATASGSAGAAAPERPASASHCPEAPAPACRVRARR